MLPRTLQYSKVLFSIFLFLVFVQYLPIFCNDNSCPPFFQAYVVSVVRHQGNISMALGVMMFLIFLNGLLGSVLEWRGIMKFYRQVAAARSRYSTFSNKGKIRVDMDLIASKSYFPRRVRLKTHFMSFSDRLFWRCAPREMSTRTNSKRACAAPGATKRPPSVGSTISTRRRSPSSMSRCCSRSMSP